MCGPGRLEVIDDYFGFVQQAAREGTAAGLTPLQLALELDLGEFAALTDSERIAANLHRAYAELDGKPWGSAIDLRSAIHDMVVFKRRSTYPLFCLTHSHARITGRYSPGIGSPRYSVRTCRRRLAW